MMRGRLLASLAGQNARSADYSRNPTQPTCSNAAAVLIYEAFCGQILRSWHIKQDKRFLSEYRCWSSRGLAA